MNNATQLNGVKFNLIRVVNFAKIELFVGLDITCVFKYYSRSKEFHFGGLFRHSGHLLLLLIPTIRMAEQDGCYKLPD